MSNHCDYRIDFTALLTVTLIALKLCNVIDWSWWWVLFPIWLGPAILLSFIAVLAVFAVIAVCIASISSIFIK